MNVRFNNLQLTRTLLPMKQLLLLPGDQPTNSSFSLKHAKQSKAKQLTSAFPLSSIHPPPAFGSSPNLEALALSLAAHDHDHDEADNSVRNNSLYSRYSFYSILSLWHYSNPQVLTPPVCCSPLHEITFSTLDKPKLLLQVSSYSHMESILHYVILHYTSSAFLFFFPQCLKIGILLLFFLPNTF